MTRRRALASLAVSALGAMVAGCGTERQRATRGVTTIRYGDHPSHRADLHLPAGDDPVPVVVVIHGGFWRQRYGMSLASPLAADLARRGRAAYAIEYRRVGGGGGYPATLDDVAAAIDSLAGTAQEAADGRLDLGRVVAVGHSAGGQLAVWAAGRARLPAGAPGAAPVVRVGGAVSQAGVLDLVGGAAEGLGGGAVVDLVGASPADAPDAYALASPLARLPIGVPVALVHGEVDDVVPLAQSERYRAAAASAGDDVVLTALAGVGHFDVIDVGHAAWATCRGEVERLLGS